MDKNSFFLLIAHFAKKLKCQRLVGMQIFVIRNICSVIKFVFSFLLFFMFCKAFSFCIKNNLLNSFKSSVIPFAEVNFLIKSIAISSPDPSPLNNFHICSPLKDFGLFSFFKYLSVISVEMACLSFCLMSVSLITFKKIIN